MGQALLRFALGGVVVTLFSITGEVLKPKRFAGIFGAAPAVALITLALAFMEKGPDEAAILGRSATAGAIAFLAYSLVVSLAIDHLDAPGWLLAGVSWLVWFVVAFGIWGLLLR